MRRRKQHSTRLPNSLTACSDPDRCGRGSAGPTRHTGVAARRAPAARRALENLRGIPKGEVNNSVHLSQIRKIWNQFYRMHPNATQEEPEQMTKIDDQFGACFIPP